MNHHVIAPEQLAKTLADERAAGHAEGRTAERRDAVAYLRLAAKGYAMDRARNNLRNVFAVLRAAADALDGADHVQPAQVTPVRRSFKPAEVQIGDRVVVSMFDGRVSGEVVDKAHSTRTCPASFNLSYVDDDGHSRRTWIDYDSILEVAR